MTTTITTQPAAADTPMRAALAAAADTLERLADINVCATHVSLGEDDATVSFDIDDDPRGNFFAGTVAARRLGLTYVEDTPSWYSEWTGESDDGTEFAVTAFHPVRPTVRDRLRLVWGRPAAALAASAAFGAVTALAVSRIARVTR